MDFSEIRKKLSRARSVAVLTGAGVSADSGVPTFRGQDGLWRDFRAEELATPQAFEKDPKLVWEWYGWRRQVLAEKAPNAAHQVIAGLEGRITDFWLVTQNVDGLHEAAGSRKLSELHGNIWKVRCTICGKVSEDKRVPLPALPRCKPCNGLLRPHIVWFGESLDQAVMDRAAKACSACEVLLVVGTSGMVFPAAALIPLARSKGAFVVSVNVDPAAASGADAFLQGRASEILPKLLAPA